MHTSTEACIAEKGVSPVPPGVADTEEMTIYITPT